MDVFENAIRIGLDYKYKGNIPSSLNDDDFDECEACDECLSNRKCRGLCMIILSVFLICGIIMAIFTSNSIESANYYNDSITKEDCYIIDVEYDACCETCVGLKFKYDAVAVDKCGNMELTADFRDECQEYESEYRDLLNQTVPCFVPDCDNEIFGLTDLEINVAELWWQLAGWIIEGIICVCFELAVCVKECEENRNTKE